MVRWHLNGWTLTSPPTTGRSVNNEALGSKEVLWGFRRMKPGGLRRGVHPGLPAAPPRGRAGITQPQVQTARALSVRGQRFPLPGPPCCGGVCVCPGRVMPRPAPPETLLTAAGQSPLLLTTPRWARLCGLLSLIGCKLSSPRSPLLGTKGDCRGKSSQSLASAPGGQQTKAYTSPGLR